MRITLIFTFLTAGLVASLYVPVAQGADRPQWGNPHDRNMTSPEKNLPATLDPAAGKNVRWSVDIGTKTYSPPIIAGGKVFIGTNNGRPRDQRRTGDFGVLMCFNESDGKFLWQLVTPKLLADKYLDWPRIGICSPATVQGDRAYVVTNRAEVVCLDINGLSDGNDGPFKDEAKFMTQGDATPLKLGKTDADIIWRFDMPSGAGIWPHDSAHSSIMIVGDHLYLNTGNGVDNTHRKVRRPNGPSLIVLDKTSGKLLAADAEGLGRRMFHAAWAAPSMGKVGGKQQVYLGGPDGVVYAFEPAGPTLTPSAKPAALKCIWRFDCDPSAPKVNVHKYLRNRQAGPSIIYGMPVYHNNRVYATYSGDVWWGKRTAGVCCIDATKTGDVTKTAGLWSSELSRHCTATPAISGGLLYVGDLGGKFHCIDADTGKTVWTHATNGPVYASALVADSKVYIGTQKGGFLIFATGREKKVLAEVKLDSSIHAAATAANSAVYISTMKKLYAIASSGRDAAGENK
ncbi:MAG: PQQ-binding-like beta-propeller repeat protein [Phycisphaerales bacterium]|nr:PQQ-binding-like beta-propeller repeat protein [Phycisphaerales bacterium]